MPHAIWEKRQKHTLRLIAHRGDNARMDKPWTPMIDARPMRQAPPQPAAELPTLQGRPLQDALQRPLRELRISVTDRCNFRCRYCMPRETFGPNFAFLPRLDTLQTTEIKRIAALFVQLGVQKIRITGGEPLLRRDLPALVADLASLTTPDGNAVDLCLTTNGALLAKKAKALRTAGLQRVTVSLDALDDTIFRRMADASTPVRTVLDGIAAAQAAGLAIKLNMVVQRGVNDAQVLPMARHFRGQGVSLRFIEYMDVGNTNGWRMDQVVPSAELLALLQAEFALSALPALHSGETAQRWAHCNALGEPDPALGELGFISSVSHAFCGDCTRLRLSTDGQLFTCLFAHQGLDLRGPLRAGASDAQLTQAIASCWQGRQDRYSQTRGEAHATALQRIEMSYIGG